MYCVKAKFNKEVTKKNPNATLIYNENDYSKRLRRFLNIPSGKENKSNINTEAKKKIQEQRIIGKCKTENQSPLTTRIESKTILRQNDNRDIYERQISWSQLMYIDCLL